MFKEIFLFELFYRKGRAVTYVYFGITFILCFLGVASSIVKLGGAVGLVKANAPYVIYRMTLVSSFVLTIITSAIMGVTIVRDFDHSIDGILFSMPLTKWSYLMGRFCGAFVTLILINLALPLGFIAGFMIGQYVPWEVAWKSETILPFNLWNYFHPFFLILVPNLFVTSAVFFMGGALSRKSIVIYMQGIMLVVLYQIANGFLKDLDSQQLASLIDPYGIQTFLYITQYWTPAEQNTLFVPVEGLMLYNRLLWIGVGILSLLITYRFFSFTVARSSPSKNAEQATDSPMPLAMMPTARQIINMNTYWRQIGQSSFLYFKMLLKEIPFLAIVGSGILLLFVNASRINSIYGISSYPTTGAMLDVINNSFNLFFMIIVIFYSGELIWMERSVNFNMITDSLPVPSIVTLLSKFVGLLLVYTVLILILICCGVISQIAFGYLKFDLPVYFAGLFGSTFTGLILWTLLSFFMQVIVDNKFAGFALTIVFIIINALLNQIGLEHDLWQFGSGNLGSFSEINLYGHFIKPFAWFKIYWMTFSIVLFVIAVIFSVRGTDTVMKLRWQAGKLRLTKPLRMFSMIVICAFFFSGSYIYYNTNVINKFEGSDEHKSRQADYEKKFRQYKHFVQPKIVESNIAVDLFPSSRSFRAEGYYYLKNKSLQPIKDIHIQCPMDFQLTVSNLEFDRAAKIKQSNASFQYYVYELANELKPGDSIKMNFTASLVTRGFVEGGSNTDVVYNGTFFNNTYFPGLGYNNQFELADRDDRMKYGLKDKDPLPVFSDSKGKAFNVLGDDADRVRFEMVVSTEEDQIAIAPGSLQSGWKKDNRNYFHYKMDQPIVNFYSIVSGRYFIKKDQWKNVNLEIYYHPGHEFNIDKMMKGMKDALSYCTDNFGPFQYGQLRIVEFPRYKTFAQSFAGTIPFSEGIGFVLKVKHPDQDLDMAYYVTAHEVAHQWWGQQVIEANVKGGSLLSEGLAQYSSLMVMKHSFSDQMVERFLKYELDNYLRGRTQERRKESPLMSVENQPYVYYNKSAIIFFGLQDYIGEENLNKAFKSYLKTWAFKDAPYPSTEDLLRQIRLVTPDSLQYLLHDMFETVTLFENRAQEAVYKEGKKGKFELTLTTFCEKIRVDSSGRESNISLNDWVDVGVYAMDDNGQEKLIYLKKHKVTKQVNRFTIAVNEKPVRVGIDPFHKLIDRHSDDNTIDAVQFIEITNLPIE